MTDGTSDCRVAHGFRQYERQQGADVGHCEKYSVSRLRCVKDAGCVESNDHDVPLGCRPCVAHGPALSESLAKTTLLRGPEWGLVALRMSLTRIARHTRRAQTANVRTSHTHSSGGLWRLDMHDLTTSLGLSPHRVVSSTKGREAHGPAAIRGPRCWHFCRVNTAARQPQRKSHCADDVDRATSMACPAKSSSAYTQWNLGFANSCDCHSQRCKYNCILGDASHNFAPLEGASLAS